MTSLRSLLFGPREDRTDVPEYVSNDPQWEAQPWWDCHKPVKVTKEHRPVRFWGGTLAQCQHCQGDQKVVKGHIPPHEPALPTEAYCTMGHPYFPDLRKVYVGRHTPPTCLVCDLAEPTGWDDNGNTVHGAPSWLDDMGAGE